MIYGLMVFGKMEKELKKNSEINHNLIIFLFRPCVILLLVLYFYVFQ